QPLNMGGGSGQTAALGHSLGQAVTNRLEAVQTTEAAAAENVQTLLSGGEIDLHNVILSAERAQLELQFTMQLRNKLIEAYQEVMRMPI
ncbi:MAG: flagellar hook-basal body complex protein FliE, partial [Armatimonadetes bacterium]|nr:flagellar hook-basal body complex protein FliE [Armatimonadota bacterium]